MSNLTKTGKEIERKFILSEDVSIILDELKPTKICITQH